MKLGGERRVSYRHDYAVANKSLKNFSLVIMGFEPLTSMQYHCSTLLIELVSLLA